MAKNSSINAQRLGVTDTVDEMDLRKFKHKWRNTKEKDTYMAVRDRYWEMKEGREQSSPFSVPPSELDQTQTTNNSTTSNSGNEVDWALHWNRMMKLYIMDKEYIEGRSNVKSPMSFAPVEAAYAEFAQSNITMTLRTEEEEDEGRIRILEHRIRSADEKNDFQSAKNTTWHDACVYGTSISYNPYIRKEREVEVILSPSEVKGKMSKADKKDKEKMKSVADSGKPATKKTTVVDYDDIGLVPVDLYEFFVDPNARVMRGLSYEAMDCIWRRTPSLEQLRAMFRGSKDAYVIQANINKVIPSQQAAETYEGVEPLYERPGDLDTETDRVELLEYYNKQTDKYIVIANDVVIRDGPLPYNHKELPFSVHRFIKLEHHFYGFGIPAVLESLQSEEETLRNMMLEQIHINIARPLFVNSDVFNDVEEQIQRIEAGLIVEIDGSPGPENIKFMDPAPVPYEAYKMRETLQNDSVMATGINPMAFSNPRSGEPVRNNLLTQESTQKMIKRAIINWAEGHRESWRQWVSLVQQFDKAQLEEDLEKEDGKGKRIRIEGYRLHETGGEIDEEQISGYSTFSMKPEHYGLRGELDVRVDMESLLPPSRAIQSQLYEKIMMQVLPIIIQPEYMDNPIVNDVIREYMELNGVSRDIINKLQNKDSEQEQNEAMAEDEVMEGGQALPGTPGRSDIHNMIHLMKITELKADVTNAEQAFTEFQAQPLDPTIQFDQGAVTELQGKMQGMMQDIDDKNNVLAIMWEHLDMDKTPKQYGDDKLLAQASQQQSVAPGPESMGMAPTGQVPEEALMTQGIGPESMGAMPTI